MEFVRLLVILSVVAISIGYATAAECFLPPDPGPCFAYFPRYYYNIHRGTCEEFIYGGCLGNSNNFHNPGECLHVCSRKRGDTKTSSDKRSMLSSLLGSLKKSSDKNSDDKRSNEKRNSLECSFPLETGPCRGYFPRYFFNTQTRRCQQFIYGGCRGNPNNFYSEMDCMHACS